MSLVLPKIVEVRMVTGRQENIVQDIVRNEYTLSDKVYYFKAPECLIVDNPKPAFFVAETQMGYSFVVSLKCCLFRT